MVDLEKESIPGRVEYGQKFEGLHPGQWMSPEGVVVISPNNSYSPVWFVYVDRDRFYPVSGEDAEPRAFSIAELLTRQRKEEIALSEQKIQAMPRQLTIWTQEQL